MTVTIINTGTIFVIFLNLINSKIIESATEVLTDRLQQILNISNTTNLLPINSDENSFNELMDHHNKTYTIERRYYNNKTDYIINNREKLFNNQKENLLTMPNSKHYINYKKIYGIRYDPTAKIKRNFEQTNDNDLEDNIEINYHDEMSYNNFSIENNDITITTTEIIKPILNFETTTLIYDDQIDDNLSFESNNALENIHLTTDNINSNYVNATQFNSIAIDHDESFSPTLKPESSNVITNIMKPSRVQLAIEFLKNRFKQLFQFRRTLPPLNEKRFLNVFSLIKFQNIPCATDNSLLTQLNGTCYNKIECDQLGGVVVEKCADGFGVCCVCE